MKSRERTFKLAYKHTHKHIRKPACQTAIKSTRREQTTESFKLAGAASFSRTEPLPQLVVNSHSELVLPFLPSTKSLLSLCPAAPKAGLIHVANPSFLPYMEGKLQHLAKI